MPDPIRQTVSSSRGAALFGQGKYATPWMLFHELCGNISTDKKADDRMDWGKRLQKPVLDWAGEQLRIDVLEIPHNTYMRAKDAPLGMTGDGYAFDPQEGLIWIEAKTVDWSIFKDEWTPTHAPIDIEAQVQVELAVPFPTPLDLLEHFKDQPVPEGLAEAANRFGGQRARKAYIAALVGGNEPHLFERLPIEEAQVALREKATEMMARVAANEEPDITGLAIEIPGLNTVYPSAGLELLDFRDTEDDARWSEILRAYHTADQQEGIHKKAKEQLKAQILGAMTDKFAKIRATGVELKISKSLVAPNFLYLPAHITTALRDGVPGSVAAALAWRHEARVGYVQNRLTVKRFDHELPETEIPQSVKEGQING